MELQDLRTSIVHFHQNIRIIYDLLKEKSQFNRWGNIVLAAYQPLLENMAAAPVFQSTFTTDQLRQHLGYLEAYCKKIASINAFAQESFITKRGKQPQQLLALGEKVKKQITPLATAIRHNSTDAELLALAPTLSNLFNKVGANLTTIFKSWFGDVLKIATSKDNSTITLLMGKFFGTSPSHPAYLSAYRQLIKDLKTPEGQRAFAAVMIAVQNGSVSVYDLETKLDSFIPYLDQHNLKLIDNFKFETFEDSLDDLQWQYRQLAGRR